MSDVTGLVSIVFSGLSALVIEDVRDAGEVIMVRARAAGGAVACPGCGTPAIRAGTVITSGRWLMCPLNGAGCWCG